MCTSPKSLFRETLSQLSNIDAMFTRELSILQHPTVLIDQFYYVHMPPRTHVQTFEQYANYLWCVNFMRQNEILKK